MTLRWPTRVRVVTPHGRVLTLRPLQRSDRSAWDQLRLQNRDWLGRWESTLPGQATAPMGFGRLRRVLDRAARSGELLPFVIDVDGRLVGQMHLFDITWGSRRSGLAGYWLDEGSTGSGIATWALAALVDHALLRAGLHRVEIAIRPENAPSLAMMGRLAIPEEGQARGLMYVEGRWRDHRVFAVLAEDLAEDGYAPGGLVELLRRTPWSH